MNHYRSKRSTWGRSRRELAKLIREVGIGDNGNLSLEQYTILAVEAALGGLTAEQIDQLVEASPNFAATNRQAIQELRQIAAGAQASQQSALAAVDRVIVAPWHPQGALALAAQNAQSDEVRLELADIAFEVGQQGIEGARTIERMNQDNNSLWRWMSGMAAAVAGFAAIAVVAMLFLVTGGESSD
jgi:hypothetical protein